MPTVILHMMNEDPVVGELDELPSRSDTIIYINKPRRRDGKALHYMEPSATLAAWPISRLSFFEVMPEGSNEDLVNIVRE
ncbi:MAG TPA: hypothetical protein PKK59_01430 [Anaerolineaceae bacterium]|nr:hypothetical protein [Anaerolineaceae bacterium]